MVWSIFQEDYQMDLVEKQETVKLCYKRREIKAYCIR